MNWDPKDEWNPMITVLGQIKEQLESEEIQPTNESINDVMEQWSNFGQLKRMLNSFVKEEKSKACDEICDKIEEDYSFFTRRIQKDIDCYEGKTDYQEEENQIALEKDKLDNALNAMKREYSTDSIEKEFCFLEDELSSISDRVKKRELNFLLNERNKKRQKFLDKINAGNKDML